MSFSYSLERYVAIVLNLLGSLYSSSYNSSISLEVKLPRGNLVSMSLMILPYVVLLLNSIVSGVLFCCEF